MKIFEVPDLAHPLLQPQLKKLVNYLPISGPESVLRGSELLMFGGLRIMTFMIFLTTVESGGRTIFPQAGISVKPNIGSALFWFNMGAKNNYDSRVYHLGCPVLYGNKWIANKWIKSLANFKNYPCHLNDQHNYSILKT